MRVHLLVVGLVLTLGAPPALAGSDGHGHGHRWGSPRSEAQPGVAGPNVRLSFHYDYLEQDETDTFASGSTNLRIDGHDGHGSRAALTGVFPVWGPVGIRAHLRSAYGHRQRSLDGESRGNNEVFGRAIGLDVFLRDPERGAIEVGGDWALLSQSGPMDGEEFGGHATARIFFPDLGIGPVDWNVRFGFTHREVDGTTGTADFDADRYVVRAQSGWYASENVQILFGVRWDRAEEEFLSEEDLEAIAEARWLLPIPIVPVELRVGGSAGVSEYKRPPYRADKRSIYGAEAAIVFRYGAGRTLIETQRAYD